ncbi:PCI domain-containing protein [Kockiozyma suomiensis]|uniref:PCI domain-containing protein n=1 Tax=Kockiozyma suomiensis TaxID=1337062 RepID=UPI00334434D4
MSDDDFMMESDEENYDFEYEDDDMASNSSNVDIENKYYNAKALKEEDDIEPAITEFLGVVESEPEKGEWGFKALKQVVKLLFHRGEHEGTLKYYTELLTYTKSAVTRNYSEKSLNNILDYVSAGTTDMTFMENFYSTTLTALEDAKNERLWLKTNLKLAKLWLDRGEYGRLSRILKVLHQACQMDDGGDDQSKGTYLLEVYALEIQMYTETKNNKKLKELYNRTLQINSAIPHPRIMGVIRECGGKMHMSEKQWEKAREDFFESFRNYDEAGSLQRIQVLKYLVLAVMLSNADDINPFESQETKPYKSNPQIAAMNSLVDAYQRSDIHDFQSVLRQNGGPGGIMSDPFIHFYLDDVLRRIRSKFVVNMIAPYSRIEVDYLARTLNITTEEMEDLIVMLILDGQIKGKIDEVTGRLEIEVAADIGAEEAVAGTEKREKEQAARAAAEHDTRFKALEAWGSGVGKLARTAFTSTMRLS